ncbi:DUF2232 domain-containing protein [Georhizobium profundi]|uniref:DUF2232 domain-containing protein n=1 Tax=Georhizobium profundi TaxID=2341112 RepID=A0A3S9B6I2_9HYPH|nr:DUF2232 domain-containing protein [Georhizobium profundi]AZN72451.1 DUF2232 domain-containing protein [Georhizobium profundi]
MNFTSSSLMIGVLAGAAAALLSISAGEPTALSIVLFAAATLPILIASLGWTNTAGFVAAAIAGGIVSVMLSPSAGLVFTATTLAPAAWIGHLANLSRPAEEIGGPKNALAWYPLSDILLQLCLLVIAGLVVVGYSMGYGPAMIGEIVNQFLDIMAQQSPDFQPDAAERQAYASFFLTALPIVQGALWVMILFGSFYLAHAIVRMSGRQRRPKDDVPASLRMSRTSLYLFAVGLIMSFFGGGIALIGAVIAGAFAAGFTLAGFAVMHHRTRGKTFRPFVLWGAYLAVVLFTLPLVFFLLTGMIETARAVPVSRTGPPSGPDNANDND